MVRYRKEHTVTPFQQIIVLAKVTTVLMSSEADCILYLNVIFCRGAELRQALNEQCGLFEVCRIASGKIFPEELRIRAWQVHSSGFRAES